MNTESDGVIDSCILGMRSEVMETLSAALFEGFREKSEDQFKKISAKANTIKSYQKWLRGVNAYYSLVMIFRIKIF